MYYDSCLTLSSLASGYLLSTLNIFGPPGSIRAWRQEGRPTHPVHVLQKGSHRYCEPSSIPAFSRRGMAEWKRRQSWGSSGVPKSDRVEVHEREGQWSGKHRTRNLEKIRMQRPELAFDYERKSSLQTRRSPPLKLFPFLPEPEGPAATTNDSLTGQRAPTSESARQPELASWLGAGTCRLPSGRRKQGVPPKVRNWPAHTPKAQAPPGGAGRGAAGRGGGWKWSWNPVGAQSRVFGS